MNFTMELRSRRSKSRTPIPEKLESQSKFEENHGSVTTFTKTVNTKTSYLHTGEIIMNNIDKSIKNTEYANDGSSYQHEDEVSSTNSISQNVSNSTLELSRSFGSNSSNVSALDVYRAAGEYWNKYPKTDYTYSIHSKDRIEIAPGVVAMPNMSRRSLRSYSTKDTIHNNNNSTNSFLQDEVDYSSKTNSWLTSGTKTQPRTLFRNKFTTNSYESTTETNISLSRKIANGFRNLLVTTLTFFYVIWKIQSSVFIFFGKKIHKAAIRVMLWDTWLLQSRTQNQRKFGSILALCVVPLLLFGGWWLFYGLGPALFGTATTNTIAKQEVLVHDKTDHNIATGLTSHQLEDIARLLENPSIQDIIYNKKPIKFLDSSNNEDHTLNEYLINELKLAIFKLQQELKDLEKSKDNQIDVLAAQLRNENANKIAQLTSHLNRCCRSSYIQTESYVLKIVRDLLGAPNYLTTPQDISKWLQSTFVAKHDLEMHLNNLTQHLQSDYNLLIQNNRKLIMETVMAKIIAELNSRLAAIQKQEFMGEVNIDSLTDEYIKKIVQNTLAIYDADKTGLVDYALESAGGQILSTRCTESYNARTAVFSLFGVPLWYLGNTPRTVIKPGVTPGECWAFQNFPGFIVIKLAAPIKIEAFSLEHISKLLAPNGKIDSAPKEFFVFGLRNVTDKEPVQLGQYKYDLNGPPLQYFAAQMLDLVFDVIELRIHSNHGNPNYTCLYRFRVHGMLSNELT